MQKILSFDFMKLFMALLIVAIHVYPFSSFSSELDFFFTHVFCRIGVPFFLMTTGYFVLSRAMKDRSVLKKYTVKILKLYGICMLLYLPVNLYAHSFQGMGVLEILQAIFLNGTFYHLWYFPALLLGMWIVYFLVTRVKKWGLVFGIVSILYLIGLFGDSYYGSILNVSLLQQFYDVIFTVFDYTRNGIFYVPIFLYLGYWIGNSSFKKSYKYYFIWFVVCLVFMLIEGGILHSLGWQKHDSMYLILIPVMYCFFAGVQKVSTGNYKTLRAISTVIYIVHPLVIIGVRVLARITNLSFLVTQSIVNYLAVVFFSVLVSVLFEKCRQRFHF